MGFDGGQHCGRVEGIVQPPLVRQHPGQGVGRRLIDPGGVVDRVRQPVAVVGVQLRPGVGQFEQRTVCAEFAIQGFRQLARRSRLPAARATGSRD
ncbi:hypothetical protein [Allonocardiopsis opalescens]|uniref:hypothetical protein n=1 Tax=Allonocardiopsis opalescens TaxID=1144618 RepID=UPI0011B25896|nr:hypothetical protein [Allonocardiopsis opalescens]